MIYLFEIRAVGINIIYVGSGIPPSSRASCKLYVHMTVLMMGIFYPSSAVALGLIDGVSDKSEVWSSRAGTVFGREDLLSRPPTVTPGVQEILEAGPLSLGSMSGAATSEVISLGFVSAFHTYCVACKAWMSRVVTMYIPSVGNSLFKYKL